MSENRSSTPHFLRVARALAGVRGVAVPLAITTVVAGTYCGCVAGEAFIPDPSTGGSGGAASSSSASGVVMGTAVMPDAGSDARLDVGFFVMPDGG